MRERVFPVFEYVLGVALVSYTSVMLCSISGWIQLLLKCRQEFNTGRLRAAV